MGLFAALSSVVTLRPLLLRINRLPLSKTYPISLSKYQVFSAYLRHRAETFHTIRSLFRVSNSSSGIMREGQRVPVAAMLDPVDHPASFPTTCQSKFEYLRSYSMSLSKYQ